MTGAHFRRVGAVRPSHLMFTSGVGSLVDLPNLSVLVRGLDDWEPVYAAVPDWDPIAEPRLLAAVQRMGERDVKQLRPAPWLEGIDQDPTGQASRVGVPVTPFPTWLRCTACHELASLETRIFRFDNTRARKPHEARFQHQECPRKRKGRRPLAVAARFVLTCTNGHLDDFPYVRFVHHGGDCGVVSPRLNMDDRGGNLGANVEIRCVNCGQRRNLREALGERGGRALPRCRGRRAHLGDFEPGGCDAAPRLLVVGASNQWFPQTLSALAVPRTGAGELETRINQHWSTFEHMPDPGILPYLRQQLPVMREFERWSDEEIWEAVERRRGVADDDAGAGQEQPDLRTAEWEALSAVVLPDPSDDFTLRRDPDGVPGVLKEHYADVVQVERLREVRALVGFTRLDAPDPTDPELVTRAPLARADATWLPASEVRGEGVFLRLPEELLTAWEARVADSAAMHEHREAYARFRRNRYSNRIAGPFEPMRHWPGARYYALHTLSHLLIRAIALECGYNQASLAERIYAATPDRPQAGILIYTAVPDAEGTLGGLVSLAEPEQLTRLTRQALTGARHCSSDPLCSERLPTEPADFLHGAACHVCLFVSETTCERGNRFLDRRFVVPLTGQPELALYPEMP